jgi:hypothetical protein
VTSDRAAAMAMAQVVPTRAPRSTHVWSHKQCAAAATAYQATTHGGTAPLANAFSITAGTRRIEEVST